MCVRMLLFLYSNIQTHICLFVALSCPYFLFFFLRSSVVSSLITYTRTLPNSEQYIFSQHTDTHSLPGAGNDSITASLRTMPKGVGRGQSGVGKRRERQMEGNEEEEENEI